MNQGIIGVNLIFSDGESFYVESSLFSNLYIANIDEEANEVPYQKIEATHKLAANFFILKINHLINEMENTNVLNKIYSKKTLVEVELQFDNKTVSFYIDSDLDPFKKRSTNTYDKSFFEDSDLCLMICPYEVKYKRHLFA